MLRKGLSQNSIVFVIIGLLAASAIAEPDYYTWVDENGVTNYAQKNPRGFDAQHIGRSRLLEDQDARRPQGDSSSIEESAAEYSETAENDQRSDFDKRAELNQRAEPDKIAEPDPASIEEQRQAIAREIAAVKKSNCGVGKRNLAQLEAYRRVRVIGEDGEERALTDEEKAERTNEARQIIQENCSG